MTTEAFWQAVRRRLESGERLFIAMVVANTRGSPGTLGARMLVDAAGNTEGTIGGGIMESNVIAHARATFASATAVTPTLEQLVHRKKAGTVHPSGLICAGEQTNLNLVLEPDRDVDAIRIFCDALADPDKGSATLTVDAKGLHVARDAAGPKPGLALHRGGDHWRYCESSINPLRMAIIGGGHCGKALARLALDVGYHVDVFDTRAVILEAADWPGAVRRHALADYAEFDAHLCYPELTTVLVMTTAVTHDIAALTSLAALPLRWLGVMGSVAKIHEIRTQLAARGITRERIDAIHGPIGLLMKSDTPPEIAVSIMAQLLANAATHPRPEEGGRRAAPGG